jgi:hypothetical protein
MDNIFIISGVVSIIYILFKFVEMRFIDKENKPFKLLVRDALLVYISVICGYFILQQLNPVIQSAGEGSVVTPVFTDNPEF